MSDLESFMRYLSKYRVKKNRLSVLHEQSPGRNRNRKWMYMRGGCLGRFREFLELWQGSHGGKARILFQFSTQIARFAILGQTFGARFQGLFKRWNRFRRLVERSLHGREVIPGLWRVRGRFGKFLQCRFEFAVISQ